MDSTFKILNFKFDKKKLYLELFLNLIKYDISIEDFIKINNIFISKTNIDKKNIENIINSFLYIKKDNYTLLERNFYKYIYKNNIKHNNNNNNIFNNIKKTFYNNDTTTNYIPMVYCIIINANINVYDIANNYIIEEYYKDGIRLQIHKLNNIFTVYNKNGNIMSIDYKLLKNIKTKLNDYIIDCIYIDNCLILIDILKENKNYLINEALYKRKDILYYNFEIYNEQIFFAKNIDIFNHSYNDIIIKDKYSIYDYKITSYLVKTNSYLYKYLLGFYVYKNKKYFIFVYYNFVISKFEIDLVIKVDENHCLYDLVNNDIINIKNHINVIFRNFNYEYDKIYMFTQMYEVQYIKKNYNVLKHYNGIRNLKYNFNNEQFLKIFHDIYKDNIVKSSNVSHSFVNFNKYSIINKKWIIDNCISNSMGSIFVCKNIIDINKNYIIKIEKYKKDLNLKVEYDIYDKLKSNNNILPIIDNNIIKKYYFNREYCYIVFEQKMPMVNIIDKLSYNDYVYCIIDILKGLEALHNIKYIHCDIKFSNMVYCNVKKKVYLIDFGLATQFTNKKTQFKYITLNEKDNISFSFGTLSYSSLFQYKINNKLHIDCPSIDFESLLYNIIYLFFDINLYSYFKKEFKYVCNNKNKLNHYIYNNFYNLLYNFKNINNISKFFIDFNSNHILTNKIKIINIICKKIFSIRTNKIPKNYSVKGLSCKTCHYLN